MSDYDRRAEGLMGQTYEVIAAALREAARDAARAMRERCAACAERAANRWPDNWHLKSNLHAVGEDIRALSLPVESP